MARVVTAVAAGTRRMGVAKAGIPVPFKGYLMHQLKRRQRGVRQAMDGKGGNGNAARMAAAVLGGGHITVVAPAVSTRRRLRQERWLQCRHIRCMLQGAGVVLLGTGLVALTLRALAGAVRLLPRIIGGPLTASVGSRSQCQFVAHPLRQS